MSENEHLCVECDSKLVDLPRLVQSMLHHGTFQNFDLSGFAQNVTYLVFRPHERYRGGDEERDVVQNKGKMREGIRGSDETLDVGWDEGR